MDGGRTRRAHHAAPMASGTWKRLRRAVTAGVLVAATVAGATVGLQGALVSPVAQASVAAPAAVTPDPAGAGSPHLDHRGHP